MTPPTPRIQGSKWASHRHREQVTKTSPALAAGLGQPESLGAAAALLRPGLGIGFLGPQHLRRGSADWVAKPVSFWTAEVALGAAVLRCPRFVSVSPRAWTVPGLVKDA